MSTPSTEITPSAPDTTTSAVTAAPVGAAVGPTVPAWTVGELPLVAYERARAIGRAGGATGELTGARLAAQGVSWDDVAYAAALTRAEHEVNVAAYEALDPAEREYRADREHWVALQAAVAAEQPGAWERTRAELELRPEQHPTRMQLDARETRRLRELEAQYDAAHGRAPQRYERPYTVADAEAQEGSEVAWWVIEGMDSERAELGESSSAERVRALQATHGHWTEEQGWVLDPEQVSDADLTGAGVTREDVARIEATARAEAIGARLPTLGVYEVLDLASHAQNVRHVAAPDEASPQDTLDADRDGAVARADLRALQTEADRRAVGQPEHSSAALLAEYVDRARLDLDPAVEREKWAIAGALHRALDDETRLAAAQAAWELLPDPADEAGWAALDEHDPAGAAAIEDAADPVAHSARMVLNTEAASGIDSQDAREARSEHEQTRWEQGGPDPALAWQPVPEPRAGTETAPGPSLDEHGAYEHGRPSSGLDDLDPAPTRRGPDRAERGELAAREADPWGHEERVVAEHLADEGALSGTQLPDHEHEHEHEHEEPEA